MSFRSENHSGFKPAFYSAAAGAPAPRWSFRLVTELTDLQALVPAWQRLLDQSANREPMLAPAWLLTWWQIYGKASGRQLRVGLLHEGEHLVGLAPLCQRRFWHRPGLPFSRLEFLGADGDEPDGVCSVYLDLLARAGQEERVTQAFIRELGRGSFGPWDEVVLRALDGAEATPDHLVNVGRNAGYRVEKQTTASAPYLRLPTSWDDYVKSLTKKHRRYITRALRDFEDWTGTDWKLEHARTPEDLARGLQILEELHHDRWKRGLGIDGAFAAPRFRAFHHAYLPQLLREGKLDLFWLVARGNPIVANYQIVTNKKAYYYQCGRSLNVPEPVRPGIVMVALALQRAIMDGLHEYDFLPGSAQYKLQFTQTVRPIVQVRLACNGLREWLRRGLRMGLCLLK